MKLSPPKFHRFRLKVHKKQKMKHIQLIINEASWKVFGQIDVSANHIRNGFGFGFGFGSRSDTLMFKFNI
jgi:hypothetical protein